MDVDRDTGVIPKARGFCVCHRYTDDPQYLPAPGAAWHYLCDKPVLPEDMSSDGMGRAPHAWVLAEDCPQRASYATDDPPEYEPGDAEAQRIAEVFADARAEQDRGL